CIDLLCIYVFFFFQAEDGIRDRTVTGVQTCALPICPHNAGVRLADALPIIASDTEDGGTPCGTTRAVNTRDVSRIDAQVLAKRRSEERRVGKEGRSRWSAEH